MDTKFDLIVVGGGPAGVAAACAARGLSVGLVVGQRPVPANTAPGLDARVYTLSPGNVAFLREIGAWVRPRNVTLRRLW